LADGLTSSPDPSSNFLVGLTLNAFISMDFFPAVQVIVLWISKLFHCFSNYRVLLSLVFFHVFFSCTSSSSINQVFFFSLLLTAGTVQKLCLNCESPISTVLPSFGSMWAGRRWAVRLGFEEAPWLVEQLNHSTSLFLLRRRKWSDLCYMLWS